MELLRAFLNETVGTDLQKQLLHARLVDGNYLSCTCRQRTNSGKFNNFKNILSISGPSTYTKLNQVTLGVLKCFRYSRCCSVHGYAE